MLDDFVASREREGELAKVVGERRRAIAAIAADVRPLVPLIRVGQRKLMRARRPVAAVDPAGRRERNW